jgi:hypothetical protein
MANEGIPLTQEQVTQLTELAGLLHDDAEACAKNQRWRAAVLLIAQSVEAALVATIRCCEPELRAAGAWPSGKVGNRTPQQWVLGPLLMVARNAGWLVPTLPDHTGVGDAASGEVGDAVRFLKEVRNLAAHPGRAIAGGDLPGFDLTDDLLMAQTYPLLRGIAGAVFEKLSEVIRSLPDLA